MNGVPDNRTSPVCSPVSLALFLLVPAGLLSATPPEPPAAFAPPRHCAPPGKEHAATNRAFTGIPSVAVAPRGRLWATWYAGVTPGEDLNNYAVLATSGDGGATWRETLVVDPDARGPLRAFDPELWLAPDGRLFFFWAQMDRTRRDTEHGVWCIETAAPDAAEPQWSLPRRIADGVMMCKPIVLSSGEWALPISRWGMDESAEIVVSTDAGRSFARRGACSVPKDVREFDEHMLVERRDGSLWMLVRTRYGIGESVSADRGATWPVLAPSNILHTRSRFFIHRMDSGNLLLVKHGPLDRPAGRSHLTAYLSQDEGKTWSGGLLLDERSGVSYPDGQQASDGLIRVVYDFDRRGDREILMATFREEDVAAGRPTSDAVRLRQLVSKGSGGVVRPKRAVPAAAQEGPSSEAAPAGLMTGRYPHRFGHEYNPEWLPESTTAGLSRAETTLPALMKQAGYATGAVGKWHLGAHLQFHRNARPEDQTKYLTEHFAEEAEAFVGRHANEGRPWMPYLAFNAPHTPLQAPEKWLRKFESIPDTSRRTYAAMVAAMDDAIGRVTATLDATGQRANEATRRGSLKLVRPRDGEPELYDLATDPGETRNLAAERRRAVEELSAAIRTWEEGTIPPAFEGPRARPKAAAAGGHRARNKTPTLTRSTQPLPLP